MLNHLPTIGICVSTYLLQSPCRPPARLYNNRWKIPATATNNAAIARKISLTKRKATDQDNNNNITKNSGNNKNALQQAVRRERRIRQTGALVGGSLIGGAIVFGTCLGFFDPIVFGSLVVLIVLIIAGITESFNEYQSPLSESKFMVQESTLPNAGMGLFTTVFIEKGSFVIEYIGEKLTEDEYYNRYPNGTGRYVAEIKNGSNPPSYIDGENIAKSGLARYINSSSNNDNQNTKKANNPANLVWKKQQFGKQAGRMYLYTIRDVLEGEELLFDYGNEYWEVFANQNE